MRKSYKLFVVKNGKLYPPMVNPTGEATAAGVWLDAENGKGAGVTKTGRRQVVAGGGGTLAFRPGWHLGELPRARQFDRLNPETEKKSFSPKILYGPRWNTRRTGTYQGEAMGYGRTASGKFNHALAGMPNIPADGSYRYRTNPRPDTVEWIISGSLKINRILGDKEVSEILQKAGLEAPCRQGGAREATDFNIENANGEGAENALQTREESPQST
jgi:hypothetical protein